MALYVEVQLLAISHTVFSSHVLQAQQRGRQPTPTSQMATAWDPASWSAAGAGASPFSGMLGSPATNFNLSDYLEPDRTQQSTGQRSSTASAAAGSAEQLLAAGHQHTDARDDVTEQERKRD